MFATLFLVLKWRENFYKDYMHISKEVLDFASKPSTQHKVAEVTKYSYQFIRVYSSSWCHELVGEVTAQTVNLISEPCHCSDLIVVCNMAG